MSPTIAAQPLTLNEHEVSVWNLSNTSSPEEAWLNLLSPEEKERGSRFHFELDRNAFLITRIALRCLLAHFLKITPDRVQITYAKYGKPKLVGESLPIHFNVSHCNGFSALAFSPSHEVGIDIEQHKSDLNPNELAGSFFTATEVAHLRKYAHPSEQLEQFFTIWTRKEAVAKALGLGLQLDLSSFDVLSSPLQVSQKTVQLFELSTKKAFSQNLAVCSPAKELFHRQYFSDLSAIIKPFGISLS